MSSEITIAILIAALALALLSFFMAKKPKEVGKPWTVPWHGVMFLSVLVAILMINHLMGVGEPASGPLY